MSLEFVSTLGIKRISLDYIALELSVRIKLPYVTIITLKRNVNKAYCCCRFGDIHLAITEIGVHPGCQMVHQESTVNSGSTEQVWKLERYHDEVCNYLALEKIYNIACRFFGFARCRRLNYRDKTIISQGG